ncbi:GNAT family N-acetyltransferase [Humibacillus xanthopallidus]|uniref:GNAT family N-acetyltransferase n=1 Tax=Humibacillus xanthopallidus TaxID=412689 RepID=UPI003850BA70
MGRSIASVQRVDESLHSPFIELWITHRIEGGTTPEAAQRLALDGTLRTALQRNDVAAFIAFVDNRPAGYLVLSDSTRSLLVDSPCVSIDMLYVDPAHRRLGVGRSLLAAASRYADRLGAEHVASLVPAQDRDANRFFARLGFAPETVRRVTSLATLQRKLAGEPRPTRVAIDQVMARRRDLRLRRRHQPPQVAG